MYLLALIVWQALGFPVVEDPLPEKIGIGSIVEYAGAGGVLAVVLSVVWRRQKREWLISLGTFAGFCFGVGLYALSLLAELVSSL
jgi:ABC-type transport system involved in multi-copper enzyme maturation permease subunit